MKTNKLIPLNNLYLILSISAITLLAFVLRFIDIEKTGGMWHDEVVTYIVASKNNILEIINISSPRPLYYLILHYWIKFWGSSDFAMRMLSLLFGVFTVPVMYFAAAELHKTVNSGITEKTSLPGITAALLTAVNSFFIYYSQEIRQYALLGLICALSAFMLLRFINKPGRKNFILLLAVNFIFILTHFISTIFIFFEFMFLIIYFRASGQFKYYEKINFKKYILIASVCALPFLTILISKFINSCIYSKSNIMNSFEFYYFDYQSIFMVFQNWFSPIITGAYNNVPHFLEFFIKNLNIGKVIFIVLPVFLCFISLFNAVLSEKKSFKPIHIIFLTPFCFLLLDYILSLLNTYVIISRYTLICLPFILLCIGYGIVKFENKLIKGSIITLLIGINLFFLVLSPASAPRIARTDGQQILKNTLAGLSLCGDDIVIAQRSGDLSKNYLGINVKKHSMSSFLSRKNVNLLIGNQSAKKVHISNAEEIFKNYLSYGSYTDSFENYFIENFYKNLESGRYFVLVHNTDVANHKPASLASIVRDENLYKKESVEFMIYSKLTGDFFNLANKHLELVDIRKNKPWIVSVFKKKGTKNSSIKLRN